MDQVIAAATKLRDLLTAAKEKYGMDTPLPAEVLQAILEAQDRHQALWDAYFLPATAYSQGQAAYYNGMQPQDNPFDRVEERTKHDDWMDGWLEESEMNG